MIILYNYLITASRFFVRRKLYSIINVLGIGIAVAFSVLVFLFIKDENAFDQFYQDKDRTFLLKSRYLDETSYSNGEEDPYKMMSVSSNGLGDALKNEIPEVEASTQIKYSFGVVQIEDKAYEQPIYFADESFFKVLSFRSISGSTQNIFLNTSDVVLSEAAAQKYFGNTTIIGSTISLKVDGITTTEYVVKAIIEIPTTSSLQPEVLVGIINYPYYSTKSWNSYSYPTFVKLRSNTEVYSFKTKVDTLIARKRSANIHRIREHYGVPKNMPIEEISLTPINEIHFDKDARMTVPASNRMYAMILSGIAIFIIIIASINYISFSLASSHSRRKEVGIRKTVGATSMDLFKQFNLESLMTTTIAALLGLSLAALFLPLFNALTEKVISIQDIPVVPFIGILVLLILILTFLSGSYPALIISRFLPSVVLRPSHAMRAGLLKPLVGLQFSLSAFLMISSIIMYRQMHFITTTNLGFNQESVIAVPTNLGWNDESDKAIERYRQKVQRSDLIKQVSGTVSSFAKGLSGMTFPVNEQQLMVHMNKVDEEYLSLFEIPLLQGRNFNPENRADSNAVIVNETLVRKFGISDPLNHFLKPNQSQPKNWFRIVGVMKDFHFASFDQEIEPMMLLSPYSDMHLITLLIKLNSKNIPEGITEAEAAWKELYPDKPFAYSFIDQDIAAQYKSYQRWTTITGIATLLALIIASLGLFGLAGIHALNKTKEISIRKVLGASISSLFILLNKPFFKLAIIAFVLATPFSWHIMSKWIENFKYHITIGWELFIISMGSGLLIACISVSYHAFKTITINPAETLKSE